jgi:hypothetical protein
VTEAVKSTVERLRRSSEQPQQSQQQQSQQQQQQQQQLSSSSSSSLPQSQRQKPQFKLPYEFAYVFLIIDEYTHLLHLLYRSTAESLPDTQFIVTINNEKQANNNNTDNIDDDNDPLAPFRPYLNLSETTPTVEMTSQNQNEEVTFTITLSDVGKQTTNDKLTESIFGRNEHLRSILKNQSQTSTATKDITSITKIPSQSKLSIDNRIKSNKNTKTQSVESTTNQAVANSKNTPSSLKRSLPQTNDARMLFFFFLVFLFYVLDLRNSCMFSIHFRIQHKKITN